MKDPEELLREFREEVRYSEETHERNAKSLRNFREAVDTIEVLQFRIRRMTEEDITRHPDMQYLRDMVNLNGHTNQAVISEVVREITTARSRLKLRIVKEFLDEARTAYRRDTGDNSYFWQVKYNIDGVIDKWEKELK